MKGRDIALVKPNGAAHAHGVDFRWKSTNIPPIEAGERYYAMLNEHKLAP